MMSFDKVLALPFKDNGIVKVLIGGVLQIIPIVSFFSVGYILECYENGALKRETMPEWEDWGSKFVNGLLMVVIALIYMIIPMMFFGSSIASLFSPYARGHAGGGILLIAAIVFIIFTFALPMAMANFAVKRNFGAAFEFGYIFKLIGSSLGSYIGAYLLCIVAAIIAGFIVLIPIIGWICALFIGFYLGCVGGFLFGSVYGDASGATSGGGSPLKTERSVEAETAAAQEKAFCPGCGEALQPNDKFCAKCGSRL